MTREQKDEYKHPPCAVCGHDRWAHKNKTRKAPAHCRVEFTDADLSCPCTGYRLPRTFAAENARVIQGLS